MRYVLGIDVGKTGGFAVYDGETNSIVYKCAMPNGEYSIYSELKHIRDSYKDLYIAIENVHSMPQQGVASTWVFGVHFGVLIGIIIALGIRCARVTPNVWKKYYGLAGKKESIKISNGLTRDKVCSLFPQMIDEKFHSGIYDAILIAKYYYVSEK